MNLLNRIFNSFNTHSKTSIRPQDERFIRSVESIEQTLKRSLRGDEYRVLFSFDSEQAELIKNLVKEARDIESDKAV
ncbi:hypothetical protein ACFSF2_22735 [Paenibacillus rhizophilus]